MADHAVYLVWLPLLLFSKTLAPRFHRFTGASEEKLAAMKEAAGAMVVDKGAPTMPDILSLIALAAGFHGNEHGFSTAMGKIGGKFLFTPEAVTVFIHPAEDAVEPSTTFVFIFR